MTTAELVGVLLVGWGALMLLCGIVGGRFIKVGRGPDEEEEP